MSLPTIARDHTGVGLGWTCLAQMRWMGRQKKPGHNAPAQLTHNSPAPSVDAELANNTRKEKKS